MAGSETYHIECYLYLHLVAHRVDILPNQHGDIMPEFLIKVGNKYVVFLVVLILPTVLRSDDTTVRYKNGHVPGNIFLW